MAEGGVPANSMSALPETKNAILASDELSFESPIVKPYLKAVAPMVRYSKLPFRLLCNRWGADLTFTPMIICEAFNRSEFARESEFSTNAEDQPLIVQFATNVPSELGLAAERVIGYAQGIDLNCGCPQRWAVKEGIGAALSSKPQLVKEMVTEARKHIGADDLAVSIKIRIMKDMRKTIDLVQQAEKAGVSFITVHGRTPDEKHTPVHHDEIKLVKDSVSVPILANGDIFSKKDMDDVVQRTGVDGIMSARGALVNPAMFSGHATVPLDCICDYLTLALEYGGDFRIHQHHLGYMLASRITRADRRLFQSLRSLAGVIDFFQTRDWWPRPIAAGGSSKSRPTLASDILGLRSGVGARVADSHMAADDTMPDV